MKNTASSFLFLSLLCLSACTTAIKQQDIAQTAEKLGRNKTIYIADVDDGWFNGRLYAGSGKNVMNMFAVNMRPYASKVETGTVNDAKKTDADYIVKPVIIHWEPRAAAWSGMPTQLSINVSVFDAALNKEVVNRTLTVRGRSFTFVSQSVEGLADIAIKQFCRNLF
jgi:hypothetical protein